MGPCRTAGVSLCPKPGVRYFYCTSPSESGVHGTAIDPWGGRISVASVLRYACTGSKYRSPGFGHGEAQRSGTGPSIFFSVTLWLRGVLLLFGCGFVALRFQVLGLL